MDKRYAGEWLAETVDDVACSGETTFGGIHAVDIPAAGIPAAGIPAAITG